MRKPQSRRKLPAIAVGLAFHALVAMLVPGCAGRDRNLTYIGDSEMKSFEGSATRIESPDEVDHPVDPLAGSDRPHTIRGRGHDEIWDLTLVEAIHLALVNNRIAKTRGDFLSQGSAVLNNPDGVTSVYDPAIRESGVLFGTRGVESALAAFDTQWTTNMTWGRSLQIQNNEFLAGGLPEGGVLEQSTAAFSTGLTKNLAYGALVGVSHNWNYLQSNPDFQLFPSAYNGNVLLNYTQPLWAGAGADVNRIAGPIALNVPGVSGVNQGVMVARINTDMSLLDFEAQIRNMVKDVEDVYWDLHLAYRTYDSLVAARNAALATWRMVSAKQRTGIPGGGSAALDEALEAYYDAKGRAEAAYGGPAGRGASSAEPGLLGLELQLRRMLRLPANDHRIIRPVDEPTIADFVPDWHVCLAEALTRREEIRRQKWSIKSTELQLQAARNLANPQFNFVSSYQVNGFGNKLFGPDGPGTSRSDELQSAYRLLAEGGQTAWTLGFQFNMPLGLRNALSQVRNYELRLVKAREVLSAQELEVSHELANAFQSLDHWYQAMSTRYNRLLAAERRLKGVEAEYELGRKEIEFLLQAQTRYAAAEATYFQSVVDYNKSVAEIHFRKGTLLENNNIHLAEGTWTPEAYKDAIRRAWARTFSFDAPFFDPVHTEPTSLIGDSPAGNPESPDFSGVTTTGPDDWNGAQPPVTSAAAAPRDLKPGVKRAFHESPKNPPASGPPRPVHAKNVPVSPVPIGTVIEAGPETSNLLH
jgi:outer membrane protein TolC